MELLNLKVKHKTFGEGIVTEVSDNYLTIQFATRKSKFIYPDSFENFIIAENESIQSEIMAEIEKKKQTIVEQHQIPERISHVTKRQTSSNKNNHRKIEDGFGPDYNVKYLSRHPILNYQQVEAQFGIKIAGFGRGINRTTSSVVLISSVDKKKSGFVYHDRWTSDGDYIYSGEGKTGDQKMTLGNKAIIDAEHDKKTIHLFVKFSPQEYYYQGEFTLVGYTYEDEKDEAGNIRKEYKFRLKKCLIEE